MTHTMSCTLVLHSLGWMLSCKATLAPISWNKNLHRCETAPSLRGSIWGTLIVGLNLRGPHWTAPSLRGPQCPSHSHGTLFTRNSHVVDTFVQRRPQDLCHETINWTPSRRAFNSLTRSSCLKFRNVNQVIFWHIFANTSVYWFTFLLKHIRNWKR